MKSPSNASGSTLRELKPYPKMKDSGIGWLGEAPAHWEVTALRHRYDQCLGKMLDAKLITGQHLVPYLRNVDVQWDRINVSALPQIDIHPHEIERYTVRPGDLLACEGGEVGRCAIWEGAMEVCGYQKALHRLRPCLPERDRPRFLLYALRLAAERGAFNDGQESTIRHLTGEKLRAHRFAFPPAAEQHCIQAFLDHADRRIRRYIRAKQKLIALLEEQKQAIIHQAVTGRIDVRTGQPYPAYKPSGVEWLGDVPEHWKKRRLKTVLRPVDRRSATGTETLLSLRRDHGLVSPDYSVFEARRPLEMQFLSDLLRAADYRSHFRRESTGLGTGTAGFLRLYDGDFLETEVFLPSVQEQILILQALADEMATNDRLVRNQQKELELFKEYRARLIADVVTGKLDVREAAAGLREVDPLAAEDDLDDGSNPEAWSDRDQFGVTGQEAKA